MTTFSDAPWDTPESDLDVSAFCSVCLVDMNASGADKVKGKCHLPIRKEPGGPVYKAALRNAAARLPQTGIPAEEKRKAARRLVRLMREAGMEVGEVTRKAAGVK